MENIEIKKVTVNDVDQLQKIGRQTFSETFSSSNTEENMAKYLDEGFSTEKLTAELSNRSSEFYFALLNEQVIGYLKLNFGKSQTELQDNKALEIDRIYVLQAYHGKKVGQLLYDRAMQVAQRENVHYVWLGVWQENPRAIRFYQKNGFVEFDKHIFKLGNDEQTDIMMKKILKSDIVSTGIDIQTTLENEETALLPLQEEDFEILYEAASDPKIWEQHPNKDRWKRDVFRTFFDGAIESRGAFKIVNKATKEVIGSTRFYDYNEVENSIFIGYTFYGTKYWGKGINGNVKAMMLNYIFQDVSKVNFHIGADNIRSQIAIERLGAEKIGEQQVEYYGEDPKLNFVYEIKNENWKSKYKI